MPCFHPLEAYQNDSGEIVFTDKSGGRPIKLPCGQCIGCRLRHSSQWAMRCIHEASLYDDNCFITLTYNPENLPPDGGLIKKDYKDFMKRLRKFIEENTWNVKKNSYENNKKIPVYNSKRKKYENKILKCYNKVRYYHCGEYGDESNRPHYHAILFGHNFNDWIYLFDSKAGSPIYTSPTLEKIWGYGFVTIGTVTFDSAAYIARYCVKKVNGKKADEIDEKTGLKYYERFNSFTGEIHEVIPEYATMSNGGHNGRGIGYGWIEQYTSDCYPKDFTTINNARVKPPAYYDKYLKEIDPELYDDIKAGRMLSISQKENGPSLSDQEIVKLAQYKQLKRSL